MTIIKVEVGAGESPRPGYIQCDIRALPNIDHVCNAWQLPFGDGQVDELYSSHMLEHVTEHEGRLTLKEWARVLRVGGRVEIHVPDLEGHIAQYFHPGQSPVHPNITNRDHAMLGFYGWQRFPEDAHQWGYTWETLSAKLKESGFERVVRIENPNPLLLDVEAFKK